MGDAENCVALLEEWYAWWRHSPDVPTKLPHSLHVRTATHLLTHGKNVMHGTSKT